MELNKQVFVISPMVKKNKAGQWGEGVYYSTNSIYSIENNKMPPVNYDEHLIKPHSITHIETPKHTQMNGPGIEHYFKNNLNHFFGECLVIHFSQTNFETVNGVKVKTISKDELIDKVNLLNDGVVPDKVLISIENIDLDENGFHDPNTILLLSREAAQYLTSHENFNLFGTTWKSSDYQPGKVDRPIHNELFKKALILENIILNHVPEGKYWLNCFPIQLEGASETPVTAVLFSGINYE